MSGGYSAPELRETLRLIAILVQKQGGEVHITDAELQSFMDRRHVLHRRDEIDGGVTLSITGGPK